MAQRQSSSSHCILDSHDIGGACYCRHCVSGDVKGKAFFLRSHQASREVLHVDTNPLPKIIILSLNSQDIFGG